MSIKTDGVMSGIKTSALISELSAAISRPKKLLETKVVNIAQRKNAYAELNTKITGIKTSLEAIQDLDDFRDFLRRLPMPLRTTSLLQPMVLQLPERTLYRRRI